MRSFNYSKEKLQKWTCISVYIGSHILKTVLWKSFLFLLMIDKKMWQLDTQVKELCLKYLHIYSTLFVGNFRGLFFLGHQYNTATCMINTEECSCNLQTCHLYQMTAKCIGTFWAGIIHLWVKHAVECHSFIRYLFHSSTLQWDTVKVCKTIIL